MPSSTVHPFLKHHYTERRDYRYFLTQVWPKIQALGIKEECKGHIEWWRLFGTAAAVEVGLPGDLVSQMQTPLPVQVVNCLTHSGLRKARLANLVQAHFPAGIDMGSGAAPPLGSAPGLADAVKSSIEEVVVALDMARAADASEGRKKKLADAKKKYGTMAVRFGGPSQLEYIQKVAGVETDGDYTSGLRSLLECASDKAGSLLVRNGCRTVARQRGWRSLDFSCFDPNYVQDLKKGSHKLSNKATDRGHDQKSLPLEGR